MNAGESRALMMGLESEYNLPQGSLQVLGEQLSDWRDDLPLLPPHRERASERNLEHVQAAQRLREKLNEFDDILPLAFDAYLRGDKQTKKSLAGEGFDSSAAQQVHRLLHKMPKYGAPAMDEPKRQAVSQIFGAAPPNLTDGKPAPQPVRPSVLKRLENGRYQTGDPFFDAVMHIESRGNTNAVSPTGAKGLFQFTRGTGKMYGLIDENGHDVRANPEANFEAMKRLTADNARALKKAGIDINPTTLYLAHQQGAAGAIEIIRAMQQGREVKAEVRKNMNHNNGKGKSPAQFYMMYDRKVKDAMQGQGLEQSAAWTPATQWMQQIPTQARAEIMDIARDDAPPGGEHLYSANKKQDLATQADWLARLADYFGKNDNPLSIPDPIRSAIRGMVSGS